MILPLYFVLVQRVGCFGSPWTRLNWIVQRVFCGKRQRIFLRYRSYFDLFVIDYSEFLNIVHKRRNYLMTLDLNWDNWLALNLQTCLWFLLSIQASTCTVWWLSRWKSWKIWLSFFHSQLILELFLLLLCRSDGIEWTYATTDWSLHNMLLLAISFVKTYNHKLVCNIYMRSRFIVKKTYLNVVWTKD